VETPIMTGAFLLLLAISISAPASAAELARDSLGVFDVQLLSPEGKPASLTRVCVRELKLYQDADSAFAESSTGPGRYGRGRFSGNDRTETVWMNTDARGILHVEQPLVPAGDPRGHRRLIWTASLWVPGIGATPPTVWLLEPGKPKRETITLLAAASVVGTVVDEHGRPREQVAVEASSKTPRIFFFEPWSVSTLTDSAGRFRFDGLVAATYGVTAWSSGGFQVVTDEYPDEIKIASAAEIRPKVLFVDDRRVRARLVDDRGLPLRDSTFVYQARKRHGYSGSQLETDGDGWFEFDFGRTFAPPLVHSGPPRLPRVVTLWVLNWRGDIPQSLARDDMVAGAARFDLTRSLPSEIEIVVGGTGALLFDAWDPDGKAIAHARVYFYHPGTAPRREQETPQEPPEKFLDLPCTEHQGWPRIIGVPPGEYELYVRAAGAGAWATVSGSTRIVVGIGETVRLDVMSLRSSTK
jgi:hypothetical protein